MYIDNFWLLVTHFLNTPAARSLSIAQVLRLSDEEAFAVFQRVRFAANDGNPFCPACGCVKVYTLAETPVRWKCSACRKKFCVTSGTIFHSRKLAIRDYLAVIALFCNGVKGVLVHKSAVGRGSAAAIAVYQAMRCDTGMPSRVIRLSAEQATRASVFWLGRVRARRPRPMMVLYRNTAVSPSERLP